MALAPFGIVPSGGAGHFARLIHGCHTVERLAAQREDAGFDHEVVREAAACCGLSPWRSLWRVELPLAWPGLMTAMVLTFAHTLGEFGIVLMVGGSIPGETRTIAIAIYDRVQAFDNQGAAIMSAVLVSVSLFTIAVTYWLSARVGRRLS